MQRHDNVRDFLAGLLEIVHRDVQTEPSRYSQLPQSPHLHRVTQQTVPDWIYEQKISGVMLRTPTSTSGSQTH